MMVRILALIGFGLIAGALAALAVIAPPAAPPAPVSTGQAAIGGPFNLTASTGEQVSDTTYVGKPLLVYFGFTNCPDICPAGLQIMSSALDKLGPKANDINAVFITVDPERDTAEKLGQYMKSFHARITGLTGTPAATAQAAKVYRVYAKKVITDGSKSDYTIDHSGFMYLMDRSGAYLTHFPHNVSADKLAAALNDSLAKK
jgi:protein SCO1